MIIMQDIIISEKLVKYTQDPCYFLQLHMNLQWSQNKKLFKMQKTVGRKSNSGCSRKKTKRQKIGDKTCETEKTPEQQSYAERAGGKLVTDAAGRLYASKTRSPKQRSKHRNRVFRAAWGPSDAVNKSLRMTALQLTKAAGFEIVAAN